MGKPAFSLGAVEGHGGRAKSREMAKTKVVKIRTKALAGHACGEARVLRIAAIVTLLTNRRG